MSFFLLSVGTSPAVPRGESTTHRLGEAGLRVIRAWSLPSSDADYVVVGGEVDRRALVGAIGDTGLSLHGAAEIVPSADEVAVDDSLEGRLPANAPATFGAVAEMLEAGYAPIDPPWEWCARCDTFHERGQHVI